MNPLISLPFLVVGNVKVSELCDLESCRVLYLGAVGGKKCQQTCGLRKCFRQRFFNEVFEINFAQGVLKVP